MRLTARSARVGATLLLVAAAIVVARPGAPVERTAPDATAPASPRQPGVVRQALGADVAMPGTPERDNARSRHDGSSAAAVPGLVLAAGALLVWTLVAAQRRRRSFGFRRALPGRRAPPLLVA